MVVSVRGIILSLERKAQGQNEHHIHGKLEERGQFFGGAYRRSARISSFCFARSTSKSGSANGGSSVATALRLRRLYWGVSANGGTRRSVARFGGCRESGSARGAARSTMTARKCANTP